MPLTADDRLYKGAVQDLINYGQNFRGLSYNGQSLSLNPTVKHQGEYKSDRQEPIGLFFEHWKVYVGTFAVEEDSIPPAAFGLGATWQMTEDGATFDTFVLKPTVRTGLWREMFLARFIADANLTVTYQQGQGTYSTVDGNSVEDSIPAQFTAIVTQQQRPNNIELPGINASSLYLEGYHAVPSADPDAPRNQRLTATLTNPNGTLNGEFVILSTAQPPAAGATAGRGDLIKGYFVVQGM